MSIASHELGNSIFPRNFTDRKSGTQSNGPFGRANFVYTLVERNRLEPGELQDSEERGDQTCARQALRGKYLQEFDRVPSFDHRHDEHHLVAHRHFFAFDDVYTNLRLIGNTLDYQAERFDQLEQADLDFALRV